MLYLDFAGDVLVHGQRIDDANGVTLTQPLELGDDLAVESSGWLKPRTMS